MKNKKTKKKRNKKAEAGFDFFGDHVFGIIIAVLCIVVLLFVAYKVYSVFSEQSDYDKAISNYKGIKNEIELIQQSQLNDIGNIIIYPPTKTYWHLRTYLTGFPKSECYGSKSCLCICEGARCESQKVCEGFSYNIIVKESFVDSYSKWNPLGYFKDAPTYYSTMPLNKSVMGLKIYKQGEEILIERAVA